MSRPHPLVGDHIEVLDFNRPIGRQLLQVERVVGKFIFLGDYRFHVMDDRIGDVEWSTKGVRFNLQPSTELPVGETS